MQCHNGVGDVVGIVLVAMAAMTVAISSAIATNVSSELQTEDAADTELARNGFDIKRRAALDKILKQPMDNDVYSRRTLQTVLTYVISTETNKIYVAGESIQKSRAVSDMRSEIEEDVLSEINGVSTGDVSLNQLYRFRARAPDGDVSYGELAARSPSSKASESIRVEGARAQVSLRLRTSERYPR